MTTLWKLGSLRVMQNSKGSCFLINGGRIVMQSTLTAVSNYLFLEFLDV